MPIKAITCPGTRYSVGHERIARGGKAVVEELQTPRRVLMASGDVLVATESTKLNLRLACCTWGGTVTTEVFLVKDGNWGGNDLCLSGRASVLIGHPMGQGCQLEGKLP